MTTCWCCDTRPRPDGDDCDCNSLYCRNCLWCAYHCGCLVPLLVEDEELADEPAVVGSPQPEPPPPFATLPS